MAAERAPIAQWRARLRWRLAGAWQWPAFCVLTVFDTVVLSRLPFAGGRSTLIGSLLAAGLLNMIVVAVVPKVGGPLLRRRRPDLPREVAADFAGAVGLAALSAVLLVGGLLHRPTLRADDRTMAFAVAEARAFAGHRAPKRYLPLRGQDTWHPGPGVYRSCFEGPDPQRDFCVVVRTDDPRTIVRADPDQRPNATVAGEDNPGHFRG
ncbi:MAG TPA: hypothetical protein VFG42_23760 [Baekduia sp.]|uniref:hypothetical protein n=1 Tax=Baekduia sp. TaxID=2600305 RepID=UPI002D7849EF|nr:hypothetical protein [Baekduia sp.]HET6509831.1 hypothetical protein [Baekduia sp.]